MGWSERMAAALLGPLLLLLGPAAEGGEAGGPRPTAPPAEILAALRDGAAADPSVLASFAPILEGLSPAEVSNLVDPRAGAAALRQGGPALRGRYVQVVGELLAVDKPEEAAGRRYWKAWIRGRAPGDLSDSLFRVASLEPPPEGDRPVVMFKGAFLQNVAEAPPGAAAGGAAYPLLVGRGIRALPLPPADVLKAVRDNEPYERAHLAAFVKVMHDLSPAEAASLVDWGADWHDLWQRPAEVRGRIVRVIGELRRVDPPESYVEEPREIAQTWSCWVLGRAPGDERDHAYWTLVFEPPPAVAPGGPKPRIVLDGAFFQDVLLMPAEPKPGSAPEESFPLLIARGVRLAPLPPRKYPRWPIPAGAGIVAVTATLLTIQAVRASRRRRSEQAALHSLLARRRGGEGDAPPKAGPPAAPGPAAG